MTGGGISVIVPTFNRARYLPETLDAVLAQSRAPQEVIVVDDGSTDETSSILAAYGPHIRTIRIGNSGDLVARNIGLHAATGEFVAFCDSDDLWRPNFLAEMSALWAVEPQVKAAFSSFVLIRQVHWESASKFLGASAGFWEGLRRVGDGLAVFDRPIVERLLLFQPFFPSCLMARRDFFLDVGGWDDSVGRVVGGDFATALRLAEHAPFGIVERALVGIRKHDSNFSGDVQAMDLGDAKVLEHVLTTRPWLSGHAVHFRASIVQRRRAVLDTAFTRRDFAGVRAIYALLPPERRWSLARIKRLVAGLPVPLRGICTGLLLALGSARARLTRSVMPVVSRGERARAGCPGGHSPAGPRASIEIGVRTGNIKP